MIIVTFASAIELGKVLIESSQSDNVLEIHANIDLLTGVESIGVSMLDCSVPLVVEFA